MGLNINGRFMMHSAEILAIHKFDSTMAEMYHFLSVIFINVTGSIGSLTITIVPSRTDNRLECLEVLGRDI